MSRTVAEEEETVFQRMTTLAESWETLAAEAGTSDERGAEMLRKCAHGLRSAIHGAQLRLAAYPCSVERALLMMPAGVVQAMRKDLRARVEVHNLLTALGVSERDLKPSNIAVPEEG